MVNETISKTSGKLSLADLWSNLLVRAWFLISTDRSTELSPSKCHLSAPMTLPREEGLSLCPSWLGHPKVNWLQFLPNHKQQAQPRTRVQLLWHLKMASLTFWIQIHHARCRCLPRVSNFSGGNFYKVTYMSYFIWITILKWISLNLYKTGGPMQMVSWKPEQSQTGCSFCLSVAWISTKTMILSLNLSL